VKRGSVNEVAGEADSAVADRLAAWLDDRVPGGSGPVRMEPYARASNEILLMTRGDERWIVRKAPGAKLSATAHNMAREFRVLRALEGSDVPHPVPVALCEDDDVLGAPFMVLGVVDGFTPELPLPPTFDGPARRAMAFDLIDTLAAVERFDWRAAGLEGFGKPDGFLERQVDRWLGQLATYPTREIPLLDGVASWLRDRCPSMGRPALLHGDYQWRNVMVGHQLPARIVAVIDWELATIGDPLVDLGWLLVRWFEPGEHAHEHPPGTVELTALDGMPTRVELADRYATQTGRDVGDVDFYRVLALFKLAAIVEARTALDGPSNAAMVDDMVRRAASIAESA